MSICKFKKQLMRKLILHHTFESTGNGDCCFISLVFESSVIIAFWIRSCLSLSFAVPSSRSNSGETKSGRFKILVY